MLKVQNGFNELNLNSNISDMLKEMSIEVDYDSHLSELQKKAFDLYKRCKNLLILGCAGTGKSLLINTMENYTKTEHPHKNIYITATTGIASYSVKGVTINSLFGIGTGEADVNILLRRIMQKRVYRERISLMDVLIIDEISMLSAELFEKLNTIAQRIRGNKLFFGGIQLIMTGDVLQLLPVFKPSDKDKIIDSRLLIESPIFNTVFCKKNGNVIILKDNFRQQGDPTFINLLSRVRLNNATIDDFDLLNKKIITKEKLKELGSHHVHLVSSNKKAQIINESKLATLPDPVYTFNTIYKNNNDKSNNDKSNNDKNNNDKNNNDKSNNDKSKNDTYELITKELQYQFKQKNIETIFLKVGARVMLIKNLDVSIGLVNGALGTVTKIIKMGNNFYPEVLFDGKDNIKKIIEPVEWELEIDNCKCSAKQIPLMLSYSITIHKSQSLSLDSAILDLEDCFAEHQIYVALSRVRSLDGIYLKSFNSKKITINEKMKSFINNF